MKAGLHFAAVVCLCIANLKAEHQQQQIQSDDIQQRTTSDQLPVSPAAAKPLKVLLISVPAWGHVNPLLAVGEELALRGHEVTYSLGVDRKNRKKFEEKIRGCRVKNWHFDSNFSLVIEQVDRKHVTHIAMLAKKGPFFAEYAVDMMHHINRSLSDGSYDIVLGSDFQAGVLKCVESAYGIPTLISGGMVQLAPHNYPEWAWPSTALEAASDDLSFLQRVISVIDAWGSPLLSSAMFVSPAKPGLEKFCPRVSLRELSFSSGISTPHIVPTVIGFEYARTRFPLTEYVGPVLYRSYPPLSEEMAQWLAGKTDKSVVYVSMGTIHNLKEDSGKAIVEGVMKANYSLLWSLKKSNQWILLGMELDPDRVLISEWTPQFSVLASKAIHSAILHGGFNGVNEALWNGVPVIGLPQMAEQVLNIGRVVHNGLGMQLNSDNMTSSAVADALAAVNAGNFSKNVRRLKKMFRFAGGARRAADLVEHYGDVGYAHLVPSYVKYQWSWVQYYNTDVYLAMVLSGIGFVATAKWLCNKCCHQSKKTKLA